MNQTQPTSPHNLLEKLLLEAEGKLPFETFMHEALYNPQLGYYRQEIRDIGYRGDFSTAATLGPALGEAVARWLLARRSTVTRRRRWHVIEIGGGTGVLAAEIIRRISWWQRRTLQYHLVEIQGPLRDRQQQVLAGRNVLWHDSMLEALFRAEGRALIISNELVDAFPCVVVRYLAGQQRWQQLELCDAEGQLAEHWTDRLDPRCRSVSCSLLEADRQLLADGLRGEIHLAYQEWLAGWWPQLRAGHMLTIDYGDVVENLVRLRSRGTLRSYCQHMCLPPPDVYRRFTRQDLTADVNFTDLLTWGQELGMRTRKLTTQGEFLEHHLADFQQRCQTDAQLAFISDPQGMGGACRVLWQEKVER